LGVFWLKDESLEDSAKTSLILMYSRWRLLKNSKQRWNSLPAIAGDLKR
jgi:hypothetical protein